MDIFSKKSKKFLKNQNQENVKLNNVKFCHKIFHHNQLYKKKI